MECVAKTLLDEEHALKKAKGEHEHEKAWAHVVKVTMLDHNSHVVVVNWLTPFSY